MRCIAAILLAGLAACAPSSNYNAAPIPPILPPDQGAASMAIEFAKISVKQLREYVDALVLCGSPVPSAA